MNDAILELFRALNFRQHKVQDTTLIVGGGAAATPAAVLDDVLPAGNWLATHGVGVLTYVEIIQIIGALGVIVAIAGVLGRGIVWITAKK